MTLSAWFWIAFAISLLIGAASYHPKAAPHLAKAPLGLVIYVLIAMLGWAVFGEAIK